MRTFNRACLMLAVALLVVVAADRPAGAQADDEQDDSLVVVTGRAEVREGETVDNVVIADGPAVVAGTVTNGVVAFNGDVLVTGTVEDEVVAFNGRVTVRDGGVVEGDVVSRHEPVERGGGRIEGSWERWDASAFNSAAGIFTWLAVWLAVTLSTLLLGLILWLLLPGAAHAVHAARRTRIGAVIGWGLVVSIGLPLLAAVAMATLVLLPLGLAVLLALALIYGIGYTTAAWLLGRAILSRAHPVGAFLVGWAILRVLALVPVLGGLVWSAAIVVGLGAIVVAASRARRRPAVVAEDREPVPPATTTG